jgi:hypothetical protein
VLGRLKFKIQGLVSEMLDQLPEHVWRDSKLTFFDPAMGGGQFLTEIVKRLRAQGHSDRNIRSRVFGVESNEGRINFFQMKGLPVQTAVGGVDFDCAKEFGLKKFDVVVGNPPYQNTTDSKSGNTQGDFWFQFLLKVKKLTVHGGYIAFITPVSWTGIGSYGTARFKLNEFIKDNPIWIDFDTSKFFNVGIKTCAYVIKMGYQGTSKIKNVDGIFELRINDYTILPFIMHGLNLSILKKVITKNNGATYPFKESSKKNHGIPKVAIIRARYIAADKIFIDSTGNTTNVWKCSMPIQPDEIDGAISVFNSNLTKFIYTILGGPEGQSQTSIMKHLPHLDLKTVWSNQEIYDFFNLTDTEIVHIETTIKSETKNKKKLWEKKCLRHLIL